MPGTMKRPVLKRALIAALVLLLVGAGLVEGIRQYRAATAFRYAPDRVPRLVHRPISVVPGVYLLGGLSPSAAYVVETSAGLVLFDSGLDADAASLKAQMASLRLDWKAIVAIFLTHAHGDHTGGAQALREQTGAKVYAGAGDLDVLRAGEPREAFFSTFHMPNQELHATTVDVALRGGETLPFGKTVVRAIGTPGHTPGSICYQVEQAGLRILFAGDVILMLRGDAKPRNELGKPLGTYSAYLAPRYRGDARNFLNSLRLLRSMPVPDLVLPGHPRGRVSGKPLPDADAVGGPAGSGDSRHGNPAGPLRGRRCGLPGREPQASAPGSLLPGDISRGGGVRPRERGPAASDRRARRTGSGGLRERAAPRWAYSQGRRPR